MKTPTRRLRSNSITVMSLNMVQSSSALIGPSSSRRLPYDPLEYMTSLPFKSQAILCPLKSPAIRPSSIFGLSRLSLRLPLGELHRPPTFWPSRARSKTRIQKITKAPCQKLGKQINVTNALFRKYDLRTEHLRDIVNDIKYIEFPIRYHVHNLDIVLTFSV